MNISYKYISITRLTTFQEKEKNKGYSCNV